MTGKRLFASCVLVLLLCSCIGSFLPVNAATDWTAAINIEGIEENTEEGTLTVRVSVEKITCESGIFSAVYNIHYDNSVLELISWENSRPENWNFSGSNPDAEDWTAIRKTDGANAETYLSYTMFNVAMSGGIKADGVLSTELHFKVLSDTATSATISVTDIQLSDVTLLNHCRLPAQRCEIGLQGHEDSPVEPDPTVSVPSVEESSVVSEKSQAEVSEASEASVSEESSETSMPQSEEPSVADTVPPAATEGSATDTTRSKQVRMWVTVEDITDPAGVSSLSFRVQYNPSYLQYVSYECLLPDDWNLQTEYTEDLSQLFPEDGALAFWIVNHDVGHGVKQNGVLGFQLEFTFNGDNFDPSLFSIVDVQLINDEVREMTVDDYRLAIRYECDGEQIGDDDFISDANEGKTLKICIAVISVVIILGAAVGAFLILRKKKLA